MKCPRDGTVLQKVVLDRLALELDKCHKCDGIWCDRGELERLRDSHIEGLEEVIEDRYGDPPFEESQTAGYMRCPRCGDAGRLHRFTYTYVTPVELDRCDKCFGIWLDDGELDVIIGESTNLARATDVNKLGNFLRRMGHWL